MGLSSNSPVVLTVVTAGASYSRSLSIKVSQAELVLGFTENSKIFALSYCSYTWVDPSRNAQMSKIRIALRNALYRVRER